MEVIAVSKSVKISPRKISLIADAIRNMPVKKAVITLSLLQKRAALSVEKTLKSAISNAVNNAKIKEDSLFIKTIEVNPGPALKRYKPSTRGRVHPFKKRSSNIRIVLEGKSIS